MYSVSEMQNYWLLEHVVDIVTTELYKVKSDILYSITRNISCIMSQ
jgi:hypothetical protein